MLFVKVDEGKQLWQRYKELLWETLQHQNNFTHLIENKQRNLWVTSLLAVVLADQESRVPPLHVEVRVDRDAEVLVRHLGHKE